MIRVDDPDEIEFLYPDSSPNPKNLECFVKNVDTDKFGIQVAVVGEFSQILAQKHMNLYLRLPSLKW